MSDIPNQRDSAKSHQTRTSAARKSSREVNTSDGMRPFPKHPTDRVISLLGGLEVFHVLSPSDMDLVSMLREGLPALSVDFLGANIQASKGELAQMLGMSKRMLARRRLEGVLSFHESERLFRTARAIAQSEEAFGQLSSALDWLNSPVIVLGGTTPISLLDTEIGGEIILRILTNIVYGLPA
ncbi:MAG: antitoxin Xre/MbcA/ParS toxin-binding domain-containing protein [Thiobacillus sp.]